MIQIVDVGQPCGTGPIEDPVSGDDKMDTTWERQAGARQIRMATQTKPNHRRPLDTWAGTPEWKGTQEEEWGRKEKPAIYKHRRTWRKMKCGWWEYISDLGQEDISGCSQTFMTAYGGTSYRIGNARRARSDVEQRHEIQCQICRGYRTENRQENTTRNFKYTTTKAQFTAVHCAVEDVPVKWVTRTYGH